MVSINRKELDEFIKSHGLESITFDEDSWDCIPSLTCDNCVLDKYKSTGTCRRKLAPEEIADFKTEYPEHFI